MGWFDEQIRQRKLSDQELFEDSMLHITGAILGERSVAAMRDERAQTRSAVGEILNYYHHKPAEVPTELTDPREQLEYMLRPHGLMYRSVELEDGWYRDAVGPMLGFLKDSGQPVALLPSGLTGYSWLDRTTGKRRRVTRKTQSLFETEAICFYRPLPLRKLKVRDLLLYVKNCFQLQDVIMIVAATLAVTLVSMLLPVLTRILMGPVATTGSMKLLLGTTVLIVCVTVSTQLVNSIRSLVMERLRTKMDMYVESAAMMRVLSLPARFFRAYSSGEISSRTQAINNLCDVLAETVFSTGLSALFSLLYIGQIVAFAPSLALPALGIILATVSVTVITVVMQTRISRRHLEHSAKEQGLSYALISGVQKIRMAGAEKRAFARWANLYAEGAELVYNPPLFLKVTTVVSLGIQLLGTILIYSIAIHTDVATEDFFAFTGSYGTVMGAFTALSGIALTAAEIKPILNMARPILEAEPEVSSGKTVVTRISGAVELNNLSFRYDTESPWVVDDLTLRIRSGEYVAIVGPTGCGKSTLVRLMLGFEKPEKGAIFYDGRDLSRLDLKSLRRKIGAVTQNDRLFQGSILENIAIAAPGLTTEEAWAAAETAGIAADIRAMPMGMQTLVTEGQGGLSGGQRQRLMIARAIAAKPRLLIFDEATSALDNKTQKQVSEALDALKCTRIIIAHRLSTIRHCDRILVLSGGKIIEEGSYEELLARNGFFAELVERQKI